jgi:co-chaperonin GroES (HSP10)
MDDLNKLVMQKPVLQRPFTPIGNRILIKLDLDLETKSKIYQLKKENLPFAGTITDISIGMDKKGQPIKSELKVGDKVLFDPKAPMELSLDGEKYVLIHEKFILAKLD